MKRLLNTLYVTSADKYLRLDGGNVVVMSGDEEAGRVPLHNLQGIVTFGYTGASPALMGECAKRSIDLCFMSPNGRFIARVSGETKGNVLLRRSQYRLCDDSDKALKVAKNIILGKVYNAKWVLNRAVRDYPMRIDADRLKSKIGFLNDSLRRIRECGDAARLRGVEGEAASVYFSAFDELILAQKEDFYFHDRSKRPPRDRVNAMLSFAYALLASMCGAALEAVGLDPYVGLFHTDRPGRMSLALDIMEELRAVVADRFVLTLINKRMVDKSGFELKENGSVVMRECARKQFLMAWQQKKQDVIRHPFLGEKIEWGIVPHAQAILLSRHLRGDLDEYPPFLWK